MRQRVSWPTALPLNMEAISDKSAGAIQFRSSSAPSFAWSPPGFLREIVRTRHGFHIVAVDQRIPGSTLPFEAVQDQIGKRLKTNVEERELRQYVSILAGQAEIVGVDLQGAQTALVQ